MRSTTRACLPDALMAGTLAILALILAGCRVLPSPAASPSPPLADTMSLSTQMGAYEAAHRINFEGPHSALSGLEWNPGGVPFLWLHGTYSSAYEFAVIAERLAKRGYHVIAVEYAGHGRAPLPEADLSIQDLAIDLAELARHRFDGPAIIGGWSRGGAIAAALYAAAPELTRALVLLDGGTWSLHEFTLSLGPEGLRDWVASFHDMETGLPRFPTFASEPGLIEHGRAARNDEGLTPRDAILRDLAARARSETDAEGRWTWLRPSLLRYLGQDTYERTLLGFRDPARAPALLGSTSLMEPLRIFAKLDRPVLVFDPGADFLDLTSQNRRLKEAHPELIHLVTYPDLGHDVLSAAPLRFLRDLDAFLERERLTAR